MRISFNHLKSAVFSIVGLYSALGLAQVCHTNLDLGLGSGTQFIATSSEIRELLDIRRAFIQYGALNNTADLARITLLPDENLYRSDFSRIIPERMKGLVNCPLNYDGPNCFNSCTVLTGLSSAHPRYCDDTELDSYIASPYCQEVINPQDRRVGDVGVIAMDLNGRRHIVHTYIYIHDCLSFTKNGMIHSARYSMQSESAIFSTYAVPTHNQRISGPIEDRNRAPYSKYFRCSNYLQSMELTPELTPTLQEIVQRIRQYESIVSKMINQGQVQGNDLKLRRQLLTLIKTNLDNFNPTLRNSRDTLSSTQQQFINLYIGIIASLKRQIALIEYP